MIIPLCLHSLSIVARNANVPDDNDGYCSSNVVFGVDVRFGGHVCASYKCCRASVYLLIVEALLFGDSDLLIAQCQKEWFFLIVGFEPVFYHRDD